MTVDRSRRATGQDRVRRAVGLARGAVRDPHRVVDPVRVRLGRPAPRPAAPAVLSPRHALADNGFAVFRGLLDAADCADLAAGLRAGAAGSAGPRHRVRADGTTRLAGSCRPEDDPRLRAAVRAALGGDVRVDAALSVQDPAGLPGGADWQRTEPDARPGLVTMIVYLEAGGAARGLLAGSHRGGDPQLDRIARVEQRHGHLVIDLADEPNRRLSAAQKRRPLVWRAQAGDVLVLDRRLYHAPRRIDCGRVSGARPAAALTLVFGFGVLHDQIDPRQGVSALADARRTSLRWQEASAAALIDRPAAARPRAEAS